MKLKTLKKKIQRLETRLREGPEKLARLQRKLVAMEKASAAAARTALVSIVRRTEKAPAVKASAKATNAKKASRPAKAKRKLNLSPERRAELSAAMTARWAAKRAAAKTADSEIARTI